MAFNGTIKKVGATVDSAKEVGRSVGYGFRLGGYYLRRAGRVILATVPGVAAGAEAVNAVSRATKGHDYIPGFLLEWGDKSESMLHGNIAEQAGGLILDAELAGTHIAYAVTDFVG